MTVLKKYLINVLISFDQLANTLLGGDPDETISSRAGKKQRKGKLAYWLCRALHWIDKDHCKDAIEKDEGKDSIVWENATPMGIANLLIDANSLHWGI